MIATVSLSASVVVMSDMNVTPSAPSLGCPPRQARLHTGENVATNLPGVKEGHHHLPRVQEVRSLI